MGQRRGRREGGKKETKSQGYVRVFEFDASSLFPIAGASDYPPFIQPRNSPPIRGGLSFSIVSLSRDEKIAAQFEQAIARNYIYYTYLSSSKFKRNASTWNSEREREKEISFFGSITPSEESAKSKATDSEAKESAWLSGAA